MAADPTLVRAAFTEASTRYGGDVLDQSKLYQSTKDISARYGLVISEALNVYNNRKKAYVLEYVRAEFDQVKRGGHNCRHRFIPVGTRARAKA